MTVRPHTQTIIMIHGFRGTHHGLDLIAKNLKDFTVIVPDLPGFGAGKPLETHDLPSYVTWLHDFIKAKKLAHPPLLLGHSFGSIICAAYASAYPKTIDRLILVNPIGAPALEGPKAILTKLAIFYYWLGRKLPGKLAKPWLASKAIVMVMSTTMAKTPNKALRRYIHSQHLQYFSRFYSPKSVSEGFITSVTHNVREFAADIPVPTLLIAGELDDITPLEKQRRLKTLFPNAKLVIIKGVGHLTHYETPQDIARAIVDFTK
jgi:pimeloyl-ACP methyl ester carboxylesterase